MISRRSPATSVLADPTMLGAQVWAGETSTRSTCSGSCPSSASRRATRLPKRRFRLRAVAALVERARHVHGTAPVRPRRPPAWWTTLDSAKPRVIATRRARCDRSGAALCAGARRHRRALDVTAVYTAPASVAPTAAPGSPLPSILDGAALLVTSGGYGGIQAALVAGDAGAGGRVTPRTRSRTACGSSTRGSGGYLPAPYTAERLKEAIVTVMQTPRFYERARELQGRLLTRPARRDDRGRITWPRAARAKPPDGLALRCGGARGGDTGAMAAAAPAVATGSTLAGLREHAGRRVPRAKGSRASQRSGNLVRGECGARGRCALAVARSGGARRTLATSARISGQRAACSAGSTRPQRRGPRESVAGAPPPGALG
mgnify:CR=1 FL=1